MVCLVVSISQCTHLYITSNDHSGISPLLINKHQLSLKMILLLKLQILSDPDRIPLTYMSVMYTNYRSAFSPTVIDANTLLQYITTASLSDGSWNGTTEQFVLHWLEQVWLYEELIDASSTLSDSVKLTLLTNAIRGHTKLSSVHNVAVQLASHFGHAVDFTKYLELLLSECAQVDSALAHSPRKSDKRSVYFTDLTIDDGEDDAHHHHFSSADEVDYSIDSDPVTLLANAHKRREMSANRVLMHCGQWTGVSPEGQKIRDQLSEEDKAVILKKVPISNSMMPSRPTTHRNLIAVKLTYTRPLCMTLLWLMLTN